jgi:serine-type D-Ala-D-Ala endopeptidase (penicillin-binding protein 7)
MMRKILLTLIFLPLVTFAKANSVVYDITNNIVIDGSLTSNEVSIASISKLMTIYTVLQANQNLEEKITVTGNKLNNTKLSKGMILTRLELINMSLISSDNLAAKTLAENYPGGLSSFVTAMNFHTKSLGMLHTGFVEPTGLSPMNYSTAGDIIELTKAVSLYSIVQEAAQVHNTVSNPEMATKKQKSRKKPIKEPKRKTNTIVNHPTSHYFGHNGLLTIKTGFTSAAGYCITMLVEANNTLYNIVVLGAKTKQEREILIKKSLDKIYNT